MKFRVRAGFDFDVKVKNEKELAAKARGNEGAVRPTLKELVTALIVVIVLGMLLGTVIHGVATGDFSFMETVWESVTAFIPKVVKTYFG